MAYTNTVILSHKIRIFPNVEQRDYFVRACGTARFAYNWGLAEWRRMANASEKPTRFKIDKFLNSIKHDQFSWMADVTKWATQGAILNLGIAYANFFDPALDFGKPKFKKKGKCKDSFIAAVSHEVKMEGKHIWIPKLGWVKLSQRLRFSGRIRRVTISRTADHWYAAINIETPWELPCRENQADGGLDVGIDPLAVESDGTRWGNPRPLKTSLKNLRLWQRRMTRRKKGSRGHKIAKFKVARLHERIAFVRNDAHHKISKSVVDKYSRLGVESLNVKGMLKNRHLSKHLSDAALSGLLTKVRYKADMYGTEIIQAGRFYPSSKTCNDCGLVNAELKMDKKWQCECGVEHDRDYNAALNLRNLCRVGHTRTTPMDSEALVDQKS